MYPDEILKNFKNKSLFKLANTKTIGIVFVGLLSFSTIILAQRILNPVGKPEKSDAQTTTEPPWATSYPRNVKTLALIYIDPASTNSYAKSENGVKTLLNNNIYLLNIASGYHNLPFPSIKTSIVDTYVYNQAAPTADQYPDWEDAYHAMLNMSLNHPGDNGKTLCQRMIAEGIEQLWFVADSTTPSHLVKGQEVSISSKYISRKYAEVDSSTPKTLFCNGEKSIAVVYIDSSRDPNMPSVHSLAHHMERLMRTVMGEELFTRRYMGISYDDQNGVEIPGVNHSDLCGSIHVPPNSNVVVETLPDGRKLFKGYVYNDPSTVMSSCPNWKPDGSGEKVSVNSTSWPQIGGAPVNLDNQFSVWWLQNIPNFNNTLVYEGLKVPNWWDFWVDTDNTIEYYLSNTDYYMNPELWLGTITTSCSGTIGVSISCSPISL